MAAAAWIPATVTGVTAAAAAGVSSTRYVTLNCRKYSVGGAELVLLHLAQHSMAPSGGLVCGHQHSMQGLTASGGTPSRRMTWRLPPRAEALA